MVSVPDLTSSGYANDGDCERDSNAFMELSKSASESMNLDKSKGGNK